MDRWVTPCPASRTALERWQTQNFYLQQVEGPASSINSEVYHCRIREERAGTEEEGPLQVPPRLTDTKGKGRVLGTRKRGYTQCVLPQERIGHHVLYPVKADALASSIPYASQDD